MFILAVYVPVALFECGGKEGSVMCWRHINQQCGRWLDYMVWTAQIGFSQVRREGGREGGMKEVGGMREEWGDGREGEFAPYVRISIQEVRTRSSDCGRWTRSSAFKSTEVTQMWSGTSRLPLKTHFTQSPMTGEGYARIRRHVTSLVCALVSYVSGVFTQDSVWDSYMDMKHLSIGTGVDELGGGGGG